MMKKVLLGFIFALFATVASAQTCPTRPTGDNTNACASTAFVHNSLQNLAAPVVISGGDATHPTLTLNPTTSSLTQGLAINQFIAGTPSADFYANPVSLNYGAVINTHTNWGMGPTCTINSASYAGQMLCGYAQLLVQSFGTPGYPNDQFVAHYARAYGTASTTDNDAGLFAGNDVNRIEGTGWTFQVIREFDISGTQPIINRIGLLIGAASAFQGSTTDAMIDVRAGVGDVGWKNIILLENTGVSPVNANACIICVTGSGALTTGFDFGAWTFSGNILNTTTWRLTGSGEMASLGSPTWGWDTISATFPGWSSGTTGSGAARFGNNQCVAWRNGAGTADVCGIRVAGANITIGDIGLAGLGNIFVYGTVAPATTVVYDLGGPSNVYRNVYALGYKILGATSGSITLAAPAIAGSNAITFPAGTTDFSSTGGASQVVQQTSSGGAFTVGQLAAASLSNGTTGTGAIVLAASPTITGTLTGAATSFSGVIQTSLNTQSTATTNGSGIFAGGIGVGGNGFFGGILNVTTSVTSTDLYAANATFMIRAVNALTNAAGVAAGTLTNAPTVGNPTKWAQIDDEGTTRKIPTWQ